MTLRVLSILCLLAAPALAQEDCPRGPGALDAGITVTFDGLTIDYRRDAGGRILETERNAGAAEVWYYRSDPTGLIHEAWTTGADGTVDAASRETYSYDFTSGLPQPQPDTNWTGREVSVIGGIEETSLVSWSFSKVEAFAIGACVYDAITVHETRTPQSGDGAPPWISRYVHLVELGMSVFLGGAELGAAPDVALPLAISSGGKAP